MNHWSMMKEMTKVVVFFFNQYYRNIVFLAWFVFVRIIYIFRNFLLCGIFKTKLMVIILLRFRFPKTILSCITSFWTWRFLKMSPKKMLSVCTGLFSSLIVMPFDKSEMHFLWNTFSENRGLSDFQNFLLSFSII